MASKIFYINSKERYSIIDFLLNDGAIVIPDTEFVEAKYKKIESLNDFKHFFENEVIKFFVIPPQIEFEPFEFGKLKNGNFFIHQRQGGPYIDLIFYLGYSENSMIPYKSTTLDYYKKFYHFNSSIEYITPKEIHVYYLKIISQIKTFAREVTINSKKYLVSSNVIKEIGL